MSNLSLTRIFTCPICRWRKTIRFSNTSTTKSSGYESGCPQCGHKNLINSQKKTRLERWLEGI